MASSTFVALEPTAVTFYPPSCGPVTKFLLRNLTQNEVTFQLFLGPHMSTPDKSGVLEGGHSKEIVITYDRPDKDFCDDVVKKSKALRAFIAIKAVCGGKNQMAKLLCHYSTDRPVAKEEGKPLKKLKVNYQGKEEKTEERKKTEKRKSERESGTGKKTSNTEEKDGKKAMVKQENEKKRKDVKLEVMNAKDSKGTKAKEGKARRRKETEKEEVVEPKGRDETGKKPGGPIRPQFKRPVPTGPPVGNEGNRKHEGSLTEKNEKQNKTKEDTPTIKLPPSRPSESVSKPTKPEPERKPVDPRKRQKQQHPPSAAAPTDTAGKVQEHAGAQAKAAPVVSIPPTATPATHPSSDPPAHPPAHTPTLTDEASLPPPSVSSSRKNSLATASCDSFQWLSGQQFPSPSRASSPETNRILESISYSPLIQSPVSGVSVRRTDSSFSVPEQTTTTKPTAISLFAQTELPLPAAPPHPQGPAVQTATSTGEVTVAITDQPPKPKRMDPRLRHKAELERRRLESITSSHQSQPNLTATTPVVTEDETKRAAKTDRVDGAGNDVGAAGRISTGVGDNNVGVGSEKERREKDEREKEKVAGEKKNGQGDGEGVKRKDGSIEQEVERVDEREKRDGGEEGGKLLRKREDAKGDVDAEKRDSEKRRRDKERKEGNEAESIGESERAQTEPTGEKMGTGKERKRVSVATEGEGGAEPRKRKNEPEGGKADKENDEEGALKSRKRKRGDGAEDFFSSENEEEKKEDSPRPVKIPEFRKVGEKESKESVDGKKQVPRSKKKAKTPLPELENSIDSSEEKEEEAAFLWAQEEMEEEKREREREKMRESGVKEVERKAWLDRGGSDKEYDEVAPNEKRKEGNEETRERKRRERKEQWERERREREEREVERRGREKKEREERERGQKEKEVKERVEQREKNRREREERERERKERAKRERQREEEERAKREMERESAARPRKDSANVERQITDREWEGGSGKRRNDRDRYAESEASRRSSRETARDTPSYSASRQTPTPKTGRDMPTTTAERERGGSERERTGSSERGRGGPDSRRDGVFRAPAPRGDHDGRINDSGRLDNPPESRTNQAPEMGYSATEDKSDPVESIAWLFEEDGRYDPVFGYKRHPLATPTATPQGLGAKQPRARADPAPILNPSIRHTQGGKDEGMAATVVEDIPAWLEPYDEIGNSPMETGDLAVARVDSADSDSGFDCADCMYTCTVAEQLDRHTMHAHHTHLYVLADCCMHISGLTQVPDPARNVHVAGFYYCQGDGPGAAEWFAYWAERFPADAAIPVPCYSQYSVIMRAALLAGHVSTHQNARVALMMGGPYDKSLQAQLAGLHVKVKVYPDSMALDNIVSSFQCESVAGDQPLSAAVLGTVPPGVQYVMFVDVCSCPNILDHVALVPPNTVVHVFAPQGPVAYTLPATLHSRSQVHIHTDINNSTDAALCFWLGRIDSIAPKNCVFAVFTSVPALGGLHLWVDSTRPLDVVVVGAEDSPTLSSVLDSCWGATAGKSEEEREEEGVVERGTGPVWDSGVDLETYLKECLSEVGGSEESENEESGDEGEEGGSGSEDEGSHGEADMEVTSISSDGSASGGEVGEIESEGEGEGEGERKRRASVVERDVRKDRRRSNARAMLNDSRGCYFVWGKSTGLPFWCSLCSVSLMSEFLA